MITRSSIYGIATATALLLSGVAVQAQSATDTAVLAGSCANCHSDGRTSGKIPPLAGRPAATIAALMKSFKGETPPPGTTIMNRLAKGYTDEQIEALAKYFAEKK
jgi:sulfide dehydrogenase cytochrome subunit